LSATAFRAVGWWLGANAVAIAAGILIGYSSRVFGLVSVWLSLARCLPIFALVGVARGLFPGFEALQIGFLIWLTLFVVALQAVSVAAALAPRRRIETARIFGASSWFVLTRI